ncbi:MAG: molybdate ABC transporter substrate-binding protein [Sulfitobacter sp.]
MTRIAALFVTLSLWITPFQAAEGDVTVFAAASLREVLEDAAKSFPMDVRLSFGGSGTMARQIAAGAPADVLVLANTLWMNWLSDRNVVTHAKTVDLAENRLVLIAPKGAPALRDLGALTQRLGGSRLAMGQRDAVPAGIYAKQWLQSTGLWDIALPQLAETDNVRAALALVARGDVPLGIVYATDALSEPDVVTLYEIPQDTHDPIRYPAVALTPKGTAFLNHLRQPEARHIFAAFGFLPGSP